MALNKDADVHRQELDEEILQLESEYHARLAALKSRRNLLSPIFNLPNELLTRIFLFFACSSPGTYGCGGFDNVCYWSPKITSICSHWRAVALNSPELWCNPYILSSRWTEEMLVRSKSANLSIKCNTPWIGNRANRSLQLCLEHLGRIQELVITLSSGNEDPLNWLTKSASELERLNLTVSRRDGEDGDKVLPSDFLNSYAPKLRYLTLCNCAAPWTSGIFCNSVTNLNISFNSTTSFRHTSLSDFFNALERMPLLEELEITGSVIPSPSLSSTKKIVSLSQLIRLKAVSPLQKVLMILEHLKLPDTTRLYLDCVRRDTTNEETCRFADTLQIVSSRCSSFNVQRLQFITRPHNFSLQVFNDNQGSQHSMLYLGLDLGYFEFGCATLPVAVQRYWECMDLRKLKSLEIDTPILPETWLNTFGRLPELQEVTALDSSIGDASRTFIKALKIDLENVPGRKKQRAQLGRPHSRIPSNMYKSLAFPVLRDLTLSNLVQPSDIKDLKNVLRRRKERRKEIETIDLERCDGLSMDDYDELCSLGIVVNWDDEPYEDSDDEEEDEDEFYGYDSDEFDDYYEDDDEPFMMGAGGMW